MAQGIHVVHMCAGQRHVVHIQMYSLHAFVMLIYHLISRLDAK